MKHSRSSLMYGGVVIVALLLFPLPALASEIVALVPGNTVVQDPAGDFLLKSCSALNDGCSLPPIPTLPLPDWFDIKTAKITELGDGRVDLAIMLYAPIPLEPSVGFVGYNWQFQDGCLVPTPTNKSGISVYWKNADQMWYANWYILTSCNPRTIIEGPPVPYRFTEDGVKVRVLLSDLLTGGTEPGSPLSWYATVRRLPFKHDTFTNTQPVDVAPDVVTFDGSGFVDGPELPTTWTPR